MKGLKWVGVRTHGWADAIPATHEEAVGRILDAARAVVGDGGAAVRVTDVARQLGVSRQTVYNYFPGDSLLLAVRTRAAVQHVERLRGRLVDAAGPVDALVECICLTLEWLPNDKPLEFVLMGDPDFASENPNAASRLVEVLLDVAHIDGSTTTSDDPAGWLVDYTLRMLRSLIADPGRPPRTGDALRDYVRRWLGPVLTAEIDGPHR